MSASVRAQFASLCQRLRLPVIAAPMFLVSGPALVHAVRRAGIMGSFPFPNARTIDELDQWLKDACISVDSDGTPLAPLAVNMITHSSYDRLAAEVDLISRYRPEIVITALGGPKPIVGPVHAYGGLVFADVNSVPFARKAVAAGADGLVLVGAGAGGHTGHMAGFAFVSAVRAFFDGPIVLGGGISNGQAIRAAEVLGADLAYMGTSFIAAEESLASDAYRKAVIDGQFEDLVLSNALTGAHAYYLKSSLIAMGLDPDRLDKRDGGPDFKQSQNQIKAWRDVWSAGHGVGLIDQLKPAAEIIDDLEAQYRKACARPIFGH